MTNHFLHERKKHRPYLICKRNTKIRSMQAWLARRHNDVSDAVVGRNASPTITAIAENVPRGAVWAACRFAERLFCLLPIQQQPM